MWDDAPPAHLQLRNVARYIEAWLGVKPHAAPVGERRPAAAPSQAEADWLASLPSMPAEPYMTAAEYLAMKDCDRE